MRAPPSPWRAFLLLCRLRARREFNQFFRAPRRRGETATKRTGTARRERMHPVVVALITALMVFGFFSLHFKALTTLDVLNSVRDLDLGRLLVLGAYVTLVWVASAMLTLSERQITRVEWDLEWLYTLPMTPLQLMCSRVIERTLINPFAWVQVVPVYVLLAWHWLPAWKIMALPLGLAFALPSLALMSLFQTYVDTGLRLALRASHLRNMQAVLRLVGMFTFYFSLGLSQRPPAAVLWLIEALGTKLLLLPTSLSVVTPLAFTPASLALWVGEFVALMVVGMSALLYLISDGLEMGGEGTRSPAADAFATAGSSARTRAWFELPPMLAKEFKLLRRDSNYLTQTMLTPLLVIGFQVYAQMDHALTSEFTLNAFTVMASSVIAYALLFSVFNIINSEGATLWLLFTFPSAIDRTLVGKAKLWLYVSLLYALGFAGFGVVRFGVSWTFLFKMASVFACAPVFTFLALSLGIFAYPTPLEGQERRPRLSLMYLYFVLTGSWGASQLVSPWQTFVTAFLLALVAYAFWQKARALLPFVMDPTAAPPPRIALADGLIATYGFFVLQLLLGIAMTTWLAPASAELVAFAMAGAISCGVTVLYYRGRRPDGWPRFRAADPVRAVAYGIAGGMFCGVLGFYYLEIARQQGWFSEALDHALMLTREDRPWLAGLGLLAAPLLEEFIFRGLVFNGLRASLAPAFAILGSAALFALMHPPVAVVPVFLLGLVTASLVQRQGNLLTSIVAHFTYNVCMLIIPWSLAR